MGEHDYSAASGSHPSSLIRSDTCRRGVTSTQETQTRSEIGRPPSYLMSGGRSLADRSELSTGRYSNMTSGGRSSGELRVPSTTTAPSYMMRGGRSAAPTPVPSSTRPSRSILGSLSSDKDKSTSGRRESATRTTTKASTITGNASSPSTTRMFPFMRPKRTGTVPQSTPSVSTPTAPIARAQRALVVDKAPRETGRQPAATSTSAKSTTSAKAVSKHRPSTHARDYSAKKGKAPASDQQEIEDLVARMPKDFRYAFGQKGDFDPRRG